MLIFQYAFFVNKHLYGCYASLLVCGCLHPYIISLPSYFLRHARSRNYVSESEVCKLESVPLDFGDYHPLKPITVSFFVLLENESEFRLIVFLFMCLFP